jgi:hypothetical protein
MSIRPRAKVYEVSEERKEITSKDLTRKQLILYVLNDFLKGLYVIGCMFLDGLVILQIYSFVPSSLLYQGLLSNVYSRDALIGSITMVLGVFVIYVQVKAYRRIWPKGSLFIGHKIEEDKEGK